MRARSALIALACTASLVLASCSSPTAGIPQLPQAPETASPTGPAGASQTGEAGTATGTTDPDDPSGEDDAASDPDAGSTGLPSATGSQPDPSTDGALPTDLMALPTDLGDLGMNAECLAVSGVVMAMGLLVVASMMGGTQAITQEDLEQAFAGMGDVPPELSAPLQTLRDAATKAMGKPSAEAGAIMSSDDVANAMDVLSTYVESKCGGS